MLQKRGPLIFVKEMRFVAAIWDDLKTPRHQQIIDPI